MSTPTRILVVEDEGVVAKDLQMRFGNWATMFP